MRMLAILAVLSGLAWLGGVVLLTWGSGGPPWGLLWAAAAYVTVAAAVLATTSSPRRLPGRLAILWVLAVALVCVLLIPAAAGNDVMALVAAATYATVAFLLWLSLPMVIYAFLWWRPHTDPAPVAPGTSAAAPLDTGIAQS